MDSFNVLLGAIGVCALAHAVSAAAQADGLASEAARAAAPAKKGGAARRDCFDFSSLAPGTRYNLGDTVKGAHALITAPHRSCART
jgi:hypothetical protein